MTDNFEKYVLYHFYGNGRVIIKDGSDYTASFEIYQLNPGNLVGSLFFRKIDSKLGNVIKSAEKFLFDGKTTNGLRISAERCAAYSYTEAVIQENGLSIPLTARFHIHVLRVYKPNQLENIEKEGTALCIEIGVLNYYSTANFLINTEIGEIESYNLLSNDDVNILRNLHIPNNASVLRLKVKGEKTIEATMEKTLRVIDKILELAGFALCTELRWSRYSVFLNEFSDSQFLYYGAESRLPINPDAHYNIEETSIADFLSKSYNNYNDQLNAKYNFKLALKWYLDSMTSRYEVMRFISASTSLESILDSFSPGSESFVPKNEFNDLGEKIKSLIKNEIGSGMTPDDLELMLKRIPDINRRSYRKKAEKLLESLEILDDHTRETLKDIIEVRDGITHRGRFVDPKDSRKAAKMYFELIDILAKVFIRILIPDDDTFYKSRVGLWKVMD